MLQVVVENKLITMVERATLIYYYYVITPDSKYITERRMTPRWTRKIIIVVVWYYNIMFERLYINVNNIYVSFFLGHRKKMVCIAMGVIL